MSRPVFDFRSASREQYDKFRAKYPEVDLSFKQFKDIIYTNNRMFYEHILLTGEKVFMSYGLGPLSIQRKETKSYYENYATGETHIILPVDWKKTKETGKRTYMYNDHTDGWRFRIIWFKQESTGLKMKEIWSFKPCREWSRELAKKLKGPDAKKYIYTYTEWQTGRAKRKK